MKIESLVFKETRYQGIGAPGERTDCGMVYLNEVPITPVMGREKAETIIKAIREMDKDSPREKHLQWIAEQIITRWPWGTDEEIPGADLVEDVADLVEDYMMEYKTRLACPKCDSTEVRWVEKVTQSWRLKSLNKATGYAVFGHLVQADEPEDQRFLCECGHDWEISSEWEGRVDFE